MQRVATGEGRTDKPPKGYHTLVNVLERLQHDVSLRLLDKWAQLQSERKMGAVASKSVFWHEGLKTVWAGPNREEIAAGIAAQIFDTHFWTAPRQSTSAERFFLLHKGEVFQFRVKQRPHLSEILLDLDPSTGCLTFNNQFDALALSETAFHRRNLPFLDVQNWTIKNNPDFAFAQNEDEVRDLSEIWVGLRPFAGAQLLYREPTAYAGQDSLYLSQIIARLDTAIEDVVSATPPRKTSLLFSETVDRLARTFLLTHSSSERPKLSWLASELWNDPDRQRDRGVRTYRDAVEEAVRAISAKRNS